MPDLHSEIDRLCRALDDAWTAYRSEASAEATAERDYRKARAHAWTQVSGTAKEREDAVNEATADHRYRRDLAQAQRQAALEAMRNQRQQLSALQSVLAMERSEAEFSRTTPQGSVPPPRPAHPAEVPG